MLSCNKRELTIEILIDALNSVTWYNGLAEEIIKWKDLKIKYGHILPEWYSFELTDIEDKKGQAQLQVIWMLCVEMFGDYGTSPRFGWIEDIEGFYDFIDKITETHREVEEREREWS